MYFSRGTACWKEPPSRSGDEDGLGARKGGLLAEVLWVVDDSHVQGAGRAVRDLFTCGEKSGKPASEPHACPLEASASRVRWTSSLVPAPWSNARSLFSDTSSEIPIP